MKSFLLFLLVKTLTLKEARGKCDSPICWAQHPDPRGEAPIKLRKNRVVAEIPDLPPSWKINFDLKLTGHPKKCCTHCANGILSMGHLLIAYSCANRRNVWVSYPVPHMKQEWAPGYPQRENAVIRIAQMINGKYVVEDKKRKLLIGHWTKFEISQLTENYNNKNRLMFKVVVDGQVLLHTEQREPYEGPVKVYASGVHWSPARRSPALPAVTKNVKIDFAAEADEQECEFTPDCLEVDLCRNVADAWCVCLFGSCVLEGGSLSPTPGDPECSNYTDCDCRDSPSTCFCRGWPARCDTTAWECHTSKDCSVLDKCADKECGCHRNLCEYECDTASDCIEIGHSCSSTKNYSCACEQSVCKFVERDPGTK